MDREVEGGFRDRVYRVVSQIPYGRVMTYGQIAEMCGSPRAARIVGGIAHRSTLELPWQRVVKKDGSLAEGYPGGIPGHQAALVSEGIEFVNGKVPMTELQWHPK